MPKSKPTLTDADVGLILNRLLLVIPSKNDLLVMEQRLDKKYNRAITVLDKIVGELQTKRTEQTLHAHDHTRIHDRLIKIEAKLQISPAI